MDEKYLTSGQAAKELGVSTSSLLRWEEEGIFKKFGVKVLRTPIGKHRRYSQTEIIALKEKLQQEEGV